MRSKNKLLSDLETILNFSGAYLNERREEARSREDKASVREIMLSWDRLKTLLKDGQRGESTPHFGQLQPIEDTGGFDYKLIGDSCWVISQKVSVWIHRDEEGLHVGAFEIGKEDGHYINEFLIKKF